LLCLAERTRTGLDFWLRHTPAQIEKWEAELMELDRLRKDRTS